MKFFKIHRKFDESKVSGTGHVIDGVVFRDGTTIIQWLTEMSSIAIYKSFEDFKAIHIDSHPLNETIAEMMEIQELEDNLKAVRTYADALKTAAKNKTAVNVSAVLVADALLAILKPEEGS